MAGGFALLGHGKMLLGVIVRNDAFPSGFVCDSADIEKLFCHVDIRLIPGEIL